VEIRLLEEGGGRWRGDVYAQQEVRSTCATVTMTRMSAVEATLGNVLRYRFEVDWKQPALSSILFPLLHVASNNKPRLLPSRLADC
jgi:hypothetical protein